MGRSTKKPKSNTYFTNETQEAILRYSACDDPVERNLIYKNHIEHAFFKLSQNIIHTFKFYYTDGDSIEDLQQEVICFLLEKMNSYKPEKGKAYSYFGTIVKRYLILKNQKNYIKVQKADTLDALTEDLVPIDDSLIVYDEQKDKMNFIKNYWEYVEDNINIIMMEHGGVNMVNVRIAESIISISKNVDNIDIFNKKAIYMYIREIEEVETEQITKVVNILKKIYFNLYENKYKKGNI